jgi:hypothetical protein
MQVGGKEVEWTLGFALAEIDFSPSLIIQSEVEYQEHLAQNHPLHILKSIIRPFVQLKQRLDSIIANMWRIAFRLFEKVWGGSKGINSV